MIPKRLDTKAKGVEFREFEDGLYNKIIGQNEAVEAVTTTYQVYKAGFCAPGRPISNLLFLGPTGTGKTRMVEALSEQCFGHPDAILKVNCAEFQHSHEIAKIIGSPPGYLGHRETHPLITQEGLAKYWTEKDKFSLLLFDEIEKASDSLWQLLLGIMDKATLTLGDNRTVDLSSTMLFMTSNLGGREITDMMGVRMGFEPITRGAAAASIDGKIEHTAENSAKRKFNPEFMNRIDKTVVFHPLKPEHLERILEIELNQVQKRVIDSPRSRFIFQTAPSARNFLLKEGTDAKYGARHLKRAIEKYVVIPLAGLVSSGQIGMGDVLSIHHEESSTELVFLREAAMTA